MARARKQDVKISVLGDSKSAQKAFKGVDKSAGKTQKAIGATASKFRALASVGIVYWFQVYF